MNEFPATSQVDAPAPTDNPALSVVMSVYNGKRFLSAAIRSVLGQTFTDFEFIIIDDGSTDGSGELLEKIAASDQRIRLVRRENKGLIASLNEGCGMARAPLIARMDGDDLCRTHRFQTQVDYLARHPECVVLSCRVLYVDSAGWPIGEQYHNTTHERIEDALWGRGDGAGMSHPGVMMRTAAFHEAGGYRDAYPDAEDYELWLRMAEVGRLANLTEVLLDYRYHANSVSQQRAVRQRESMLLALRHAAERRGVDAPSPGQFGFVKNMTRGDVHIRIVELAKANGHHMTATKHRALRVAHALAKRMFPAPPTAPKPQAAGDAT